MNGQVNVACGSRRNGCCVLFFFLVHKDSQKVFVVQDTEFVWIELLAIIPLNELITGVRRCFNAYLSSVLVVGIIEVRNYSTHFQIVALYQPTTHLYSENSSKRRILRNDYLSWVIHITI